ncbi:type II toxin-antitoxin system PemK/MazF family toxin [Mesorhizobium sp. KR2-14]|uniref:type II toxin-antitoxin system PemK/MazF family toxin n=1 Tax=Mesorhizobium sp. KR2-14 TaxID=3156610 RepID=UPI0032B55D1D
MASLPKPVPGLVIRYSYLWVAEHRAGQEEGRKDRPCAIVLTATDEAEGTTVTVLPITHSPPSSASLAIEIPAPTKNRLGLDGARSWILLTEANRFIWPGPDLRPSRAGDATSVAYGLLPAAFFRDVRSAFARAARDRRALLVSRTQ